MAKNTGRPTARTPEMETRLEAALSMGSTIAAACFHAGISESTYYDWAAKDEKFSERMKALRHNPVLKALSTVYNDLESVSTAKWYLERKCKDEYGTQPVISEDQEEIKPIKIEIIDAS
jgi:hypothetical protein